MDFLQSTTHTPENITNIAGCYEMSNGFSGSVLELQTDSTYFRSSWDRLTASKPLVRGQEGDFRLFGDVVVLRFQSSTPDTMNTEERLEQPHQEATSIYRFKMVRDTLFAVPPRLELFFAEEAQKNGGMPPLWGLSDGTRSSMFFFTHVDSLPCKR